MLIGCQKIVTGNLGNLLPIKCEKKESFDANVPINQHYLGRWTAPSGLQIGRVNAILEPLKIW